ncbi:putative UBP type Zn finger protein [Actinokineospora baliensis]|uniref:UBP-type zinc finger domain-containing protein n=1 Tax=Actinokineospora baliensis TaxID=547056 RepID=UPI00195CFDA1|nr:UBP-type zinc finger domain-containing protein [Actinokineospora baliensis]MBM7770800.1 putative UBP type Zn finger protein [Actinokineospora baliensis]
MTCEHTDTLPAGVTAEADVCQDCVAEGNRHWVHLRLCLSCGHVGCCDSSPLKHATAHHKATDHPVIQSHEPGENWRWCYVDNRIV